MTHGHSVITDGPSVLNWVLLGSLEINFNYRRMVHGSSRTIREIINNEDQVCGYEFWLRWGLMCVIHVQEVSSVVLGSSYHVHHVDL